MKRWTAILLVCLVALLAGLMVLRPLLRPPRLSEVALYVQGDGSVELNGRHFADIALLQAALVDACGQRPRPIFRLRNVQGASIETVNAVIGVAGKAGCMG